MSYHLFSLYSSILSFVWYLPSHLPILQFSSLLHVMTPLSHIVFFLWIHFLHNIQYCHYCLFKVLHDFSQLSYIYSKIILIARYISNNFSPTALSPLAWYLLSTCIWFIYSLNLFYAWYLLNYIPSKSFLYGIFSTMSYLHLN